MSTTVSFFKHKRIRSWSLVPPGESGFWLAQSVLTHQPAQPLRGCWELSRSSACLTFDTHGHLVYKPNHGNEAKIPAPQLNARISTPTEIQRLHTRRAGTNLQDHHPYYLALGNRRESYPLHRADCIERSQTATTEAQKLTHSLYA